MGEPKKESGGVSIEAEKNYIDFWKDDFWREEYDDQKDGSVQKRLDFEEWVKCWTPELRKSYIEVGVEFISDLHDKNVDTIVFMDKSARPLASFFRSLWKRVFPNEEVPEMKFMVPIDKNMPVEGDMEGYDEGIKKRAAQFKKVFSGYSENFENKNVCVVDEIVAEGYTSNIAEEIIKRSFPSANVLKGNIYGGWAGRDIQPPEGSKYTEFADSVGALGLSRILYNDPDKGVEEVEGSVLVRYTPRKSPLKETRRFKLNLVGKFERLDRESVKGVDKRIKRTHLEEDKERLLRIRERYEKLI